MSESGCVLIVDDDPATVDLLKVNMQVFGLESLSATDGVSALEILKTDTYSIRLVLLDIAMPRMNGFEVCRAIRANPATAHLPVIAITARAGADVFDLAVEAGIDRVIVKPFVNNDLRALLKTYGLIC